ncbi:MAG: hypothetical protein OXQ29_23150 [Rhodospirillaceae bacterium]|nr:hypothetical protein [Rhodospirillaceae bacterium]
MPDKVLRCVNCGLTLDQIKMPCLHAPAVYIRLNERQPDYLKSKTHDMAYVAPGKSRGM